MTGASDNRASHVTVLFFRAPWCSVCRSMEPDLDALVGEYADTVEVEVIDVSHEPDRAHQHGVRGTPTIIVLDGEGRATYRHTGRLTRAELADLFANGTQGAGAARPRRRDRTLRVGAGLVLAGLGLISGPAWPLVGIGGVIAGVSAIAGRKP